jgi:hypothetical protein
MRWGEVRRSLFKEEAVIVKWKEIEVEGGGR